MERLNRKLNRARVLLGCGLGLIVATSGCRTPRSEVPPGPPIMKEPTTSASSGMGPGTAPVGFGSDPHPGLLPPNQGVGRNQGMASNPYNTPGAGTPAGTFGGPAGGPPQVNYPPRPNMAPPSDFDPSARPASATTPGAAPSPSSSPAPAAASAPAPAATHSMGDEDPTNVLPPINP